MDFYVHIKPRADTDSIDISISAVFYLYDGGKCISTGECEKRFLEYVCEGE
jgi:hypothetical protein